MIGTISVVFTINKAICCEAHLWMGKALQVSGVFRSNDGVVLQIAKER